MLQVFRIEKEKGKVNRTKMNSVMPLTRFLNGEMQSD